LEMTQHIIGYGLTEHDALTLSSVNKNASERRQKEFQERKPTLD
jgi:hypothetical protein